MSNLVEQQFFIKITRTVLFGSMGSFRSDGALNVGKILSDLLLIVSSEEELNLEKHRLLPAVTPTEASVNWDVSGWEGLITTVSHDEVVRYHQ